LKLFFGKAARETCSGVFVPTEHVVTYIEGAGKILKSEFRVTRP